MLHVLFSLFLTFHFALALLDSTVVGPTLLSTYSH